MQNIGGIDVPELGDFALIPGHLEEMARDMLAAIDTKIAAALSPINAKITDIYSKIPTQKAVWGRTAVTTNTAGLGKITHNAGWVPSMAFFTPEVGSAQPVAVALKRGTGYDPTTTTLYVDVARVDTGAAYVGTVYINWIVRD